MTTTAVPTTGGMSTTGMSADDTVDETGEPIFDVGGGIDLDPIMCVDCSIFIDSQQSGTFDIQGGNVFATAELDGEVVYALGDYGAGRFIATADSHLPYNEETDCPLHEWLADTSEPDPSRLLFGWTTSDGPLDVNVPFTEAGVHLPVEYIGNPALLAADYDIVMYFEASGQHDMLDEPSDEEMQTLLDYVFDFGGGLYVSSEFARQTAYLTPNDLESVNRLLMPLGVEALLVTLPWGDVNGNIEFDCFPAPVG